jgi:hypothetical protein
LRDARRTVEFGAIEILLERFQPACSAEVLRASTAGRDPAILRYRIKASRGVFEVESDGYERSVTLSHTQTLYGRCNEIKNTEGSSR